MTVTRAQWIEGARPRTLPAAIAPVLVGTGAAIGITDGWGLTGALRAVLAMVVALALQVGVNYANDYSDGIRGTDTDRVGPFRLTGSGTAAPQQVKRAAFAAFGVAGLAGLLLVASSGQWWLLAVGAVSVLAAWWYTGGRHPYGYLGLGELFVFVFFGLVATVGTTFTQAGQISWPAAAGAAAIGLLACAILVANNLRDISTDAVTGKRTLAVRLGDRRTRILYTAMILGAFTLGITCALQRPWALIVIVAAGAALSPLRRIRSGAVGRDLIPVLRDTGRTELVFGALLAVGLSLPPW